MRKLPQSASVPRKLTQTERDMVRDQSRKCFCGSFRGTSALVTISVAAGLHDFRRAAPLIGFVLILWIISFISVASRTHTVQILNSKLQLFVEQQRWKQKIRLASIGGYFGVVVGLVSFVAIDARADASRLRGFCGYAFFIVFMFLASNNRSKVNWRLVSSALILHFLVAIATLKWAQGRWLFMQISQLVVKFLGYSQQGTKFVFGFVADPPEICDLPPALLFTALQTLIYFGAIVGVLFHFGIIQMVLTKLATVMRIVVGTTAVESLNAWGCTFLGMSESPLMVRPYLDKLTDSEMHAVLTSGFACIAGTLFAAYTALGACPDYLLTASLMSAPCSLACSKLMFPETEPTMLADEDLKISHGSTSGVMETLSSGATAMVSLVLAIGANLVMSVAILALLDDVIAYAGELIGFGGWSFQVIFGYLFFPLAYLMGVTDDLDQTLLVAQLMGTKTTVNEFVAYRRLGDLQKDNKLSPRAAMIATYALCGFSNFGCTGMQIETLGTLAPSKKSAIAQMVMRALCAGAITCFMNATIAGILVDNPMACGVRHRANGSETCFRIPYV